jgi:DHA3 family macrolide efflux protein-like MFS transporter
MLAIPIGTAIAGPVSDAVGIQTWFIVGGVAMILSGIVGFLIPAMRNLEYHPKHTQPEATLEPDNIIGK